MAFKRSDENKDECSSCEDKNKQTNLSSSGLKEGEKAFQLCGTHLYVVKSLNHNSFHIN